MLGNPPQCCLAGSWKWLPPDFWLRDKCETLRAGNNEQAFHEWDDADVWEAAWWRDVQWCQRAGPRTGDRSEDSGQGPQVPGIKFSYPFQALPYWKHSFIQPDGMHTVANEVCLPTYCYMRCK